MIFCVERLRDFHHSFTQSPRLHDYFWRLCNFFCGEIAFFFWWRGCVVFFEMGLHNFFVWRGCLKKSFLVKTVFW